MKAVMLFSLSMPTGFYRGHFIYNILYSYRDGVTNRYVGNSFAQDTLLWEISCVIMGIKALTGGFSYNPIFGIASRFGEH